MAAARLLSVFDACVVDAIARVVEEFGEAVALRRLTRAAGRRDWWLLRGSGDLDALLASGRPADALVVFRRPQFGVRGVADERLAGRVEKLLATELPGTEVVVGQRLVGDPILHDVESFWRPSEPHRAWRPEDGDAAGWFEEHAGAEVVGGIHPPLFSDDPEEVLAAFWPDADGVVEVGIY